MLTFYILSGSLWLGAFSDGKAPRKSGNIISTHLLQLHKQCTDNLCQQSHSSNDNRTIKWLYLLLFQLLLKVVNFFNVVIMQLLQLFFCLIVSQTRNNNQSQFFCIQCIVKNLNLCEYCSDVCQVLE